MTDDEDRREATGPRSMREALVTQALEDIDALILRIEALPERVAQHEAKALSVASALTDSAEKYRENVAKLSEVLATNMLKNLQKQASDIAARTTDEVRAAMQSAAVDAFANQANSAAGQLGRDLQVAANDFQRIAWKRVVENMIVGMVCSGLTAALVLIAVN